MNATEQSNALQGLIELNRRLDDKKALAEKLSLTILQLVRGGFDAGVSPAGAKWLPLKIRKGGDPLVDTGALRDSIKATVAAGGEEIELSTEKIQGALQQFGGTVRPKKAGGYLAFMGSGGHPVFAKEVYVPARPYLPGGNFSNTWTSAIDASIEQYFDLGME